MPKLNKLSLQLFIKKRKNLKRVHIIGSGIAGLAASVRLAKAGFKVSVFESAAHPGGKLCEMNLGAYRFDKGPSLFTMPNLVNELGELTKTKSQFKFQKLNDVCHYFYEDGTRLKAKSDLNAFADEIQQHLGESREAVLHHLEHSAQLYHYTADLFLHQSLHKPLNFFNIKTIKAIGNIKKLQLSKTMHEANAKRFKNPKTVQLFNRYATYNGSNPYKAPALLNIIPHLEYNIGAFMPNEGMNDITKYIYGLAKEQGVEFYFNHKVEDIVVENEKVKGVKANGSLFESDIVLSDADMHVVYQKLLPSKYSLHKLLNQEKSSSAYIFYWGIKREFTELGVHNILFSDNYEKEFEQLFNSDKPYHDPTVYIHISSKVCKKDAPSGCENWFILINAPHNKSHLPIGYFDELKLNVIKKVNRILKTDILPYIEEESTWDPFTIEKDTSSYGGSLYGNSSNNKFSAFLRHANYSSKIKGLYFCGGSVHPGGGIPLCLLSAKIAGNMIIDKYN